MSQEAAPEPRARKAFPTWYSGRSYRSRLEADFARLLDALQICFEYEPQSFLLDDGTHYLPDFWCPDLDLWVETRGYRSEKGSRQINGFARLLQALSREALPRNPRLPKNSPRCPKIHRRGQQGAPDGAGAVPGLLRPPMRRAASISRCRPWRKAEQQDCDMALTSMMG